MINKYSKIKIYDDKDIIRMMNEEVRKCKRKGFNRKYTKEMTVELIKLNICRIFNELKIHLNQVYELNGKLYVKIRQGYVDSLRESNLVIEVKK